MSKISELPRVELSMPLKFWSMIMVTLDHKIKNMVDLYGFGQIGMKIVIRNGIVKDLVFTDEVRVRQDNQKTKSDIPA